MQIHVRFVNQHSVLKATSVYVGAIGNSDQASKHAPTRTQTQIHKHINSGLSGLWWFHQPFVSGIINRFVSQRKRDKTGQNRSSNFCYDLSPFWVTTFSFSGYLNLRKIIKFTPLHLVTVYFPQHIHVSSVTVANHHVFVSRITAWSLQNSRTPIVSQYYLHSEQTFKS